MNVSLYLIKCLDRDRIKRLERKEEFKRLVKKGIHNNPIERRYYKTPITEKQSESDSQMQAKSNKSSSGIEYEKFGS